MEATMPATWNIDQLRRMVGDVDDNKLSAILAIEPTPEDVEEALTRLGGGEAGKPDGRWPLQGKAAEIFEILVADVEDGELH
jgi:hypothetical protein